MAQKKKTSKPLVPAAKQPAAKLLTADALLPLTDGVIFEPRKLAEIAGLLRRPENIPQPERDARIQRALELYEDWEPQGAAEAKLAAQAVRTHSAALDCLRRAAAKEQSYEGQDSDVKHAQELMVLYAQQMAALDKHQGRGQQKVTAEHVHVHSSGQAIIGNVERHDERNEHAAAPPALVDAPEIPLELPMAPASKTRARS